LIGDMPRGQELGRLIYWPIAAILADYADQGMFGPIEKSMVRLDAIVILKHMHEDGSTNIFPDMIRIVSALDFGLWKSSMKYSYLFHESMFGVVYFS
jgi:hypothetical protein